jgi:hypothetical protein
MSYESAASHDQRQNGRQQHQGGYGDMDLEMTGSNRNFGNSSTAKAGGDMSQISHSTKETDEDLR